MVDELDFNKDKGFDIDDIIEDNAETMLNSLTWGNISYNINEGNYTLEAAKKLFPSHSELIDKIYKRDYRENYQ